MKRGTIREVFPPLEKTDCFMMRLTPQDKASLRTAARCRHEHERLLAPAAPLRHRDQTR